MPETRCRYTPSVRGDPVRGRVCCWRPVYSDADRCIWHADRRDKSIVDITSIELHPGERLDGAVLQGLDLRGTEQFSNTVLIGADLTDTNVTGSDFSGADLRQCKFRNVTAKRTDFSKTNFEKATITNADLRDADLSMARLDGADLSSTLINGDTSFGERTPYEVELKRSDEPDAKRDLLEIAIRTYRKLEQLSQENTLYSQASNYYRKSKDVRRQYNWQMRNYPSAILAEASRWFTGYGNRPFRVIWTSVGVVLLAAFVYPLLGGLRRTASSSSMVYSFPNPWYSSPEQAGMVLLKSVYFSVVTFTTLGYGNLEPSTTIGQYVAILEAGLGSILLALLVAVLTRSTWLR